MLNLSDGRYAKIAVALDLSQGQSDGAGAEGSAAGSGETAVGTLQEEPLVREIVTNVVTGESGETLISQSGRREVKHKILKDIKQNTDIKVDEVAFPVYLTVQ